MDGDSEPLSGVLIQLLAEDKSTVLATTTTDANGQYEFPDILPGIYYVREVNSEECSNDVSDQDDKPDDDSFDSDTTVDNLIGVEVLPGEDDDGNNFNDAPAPTSAPTGSPTGNPTASPTALPTGSPTLSPTGTPTLSPTADSTGSISGTVKDASGVGLPDAIITLLDGTGDVVATFKTDNSGVYEFTGLPAGEYTVVESNPPGYPMDISDRDENDDKDPTDGDSVVDNKISVSLTPGEADDGNNFVDAVAPTGSPTGAPTGSPTGAPTGSPSGSPSGSPTRSPVEPAASGAPTGRPTGAPSRTPTGAPTGAPTGSPTGAPTGVPTSSPAMDKTASISGTVKDASGVGLADAIITLLDSAGGVVATYKTDNSGDYKFKDLPAGNYTVQEVNPPGYPTDMS